MKIVIIGLLFLVSCNQNDGLFQSTPPGTENVKSIKIVPVEQRDKPVAGTTYDVQVIGVNDDGSEIDLTRYSSFETKDRQIATVDDNGVITGVGYGDYQIQANFAGHSNRFSGSFFESRIVSLAIKHAAVSLEAGGCLDSDPNTNCGLVIGQDTTPKFVATFENGDRANLRNSPNLIVEKNSSSISIESDGPLAKSIRALTAGDYSLTATYTNDFDSTDTLTVTTDTYKVVADSPKYLLIDGDIQGTTAEEFVFTPIVVNTSNTAFSPIPHAEADSGICLVIDKTVTSCVDVNGDGFDDTTIKGVVTQSDSLYSYKTGTITIKYDLLSSSYLIKSDIASSDPIEFKAFYGDPTKDFSILVEEEDIQCVGFLYSEEKFENMGCTKSRDTNKQWQYTCSGQASCDSIFQPNTAASFPENYAATLTPYKGFVSGTDFIYKGVAGKPTYSSDDKDHVSINLLGGKLTTGDATDTDAKVKMSYVGFTQERAITVTETTETPSLKILIGGEDITTIDSIPSLLADISEIISDPSTLGDYIFDVSSSDRQAYVGSQNPLRFMIVHLPANITLGVGLLSGSATITATKLDGSANSSTLTIANEGS